jgi:two-component system response regulator MprA
MRALTPSWRETAMARVLVVDDDQKLRRMLRRTLMYEGFDVVTAADGNEALEQAASAQPDVIVLDWLMPGPDGVWVIERLRDQGEKAMILMLTARDAIEDRVEGLEAGADDYLVKPFAPAELLARVHALLRRRAPEGEADAVLTYTDLTLDSRTRETARGDRGFTLTPTEYSLLEYLMRHPRQVLLRHQILEEVWGYDFGGDDNVLEVYIGYLRRKTEKGGERRLIQTVRGVGYVLREE